MINYLLKPTCCQTICNGVTVFTSIKYASDGNYAVIADKQSGNLYFSKFAYR